MMNERVQSWLDQNPDAATFLLAATDLNGVVRAKRIPRSAVAKLSKGTLKIPLAVMGLDLRGHDAAASGEVFETGDPDGICRSTGRGILAIDAFDRATPLLPTWLFNEDGSPYQSDPRQALAEVLSRYEQHALKPVCAAEIEFYLYDPKSQAPDIRPAAQTGERGGYSSLYAASELEALRAFLDDVNEACARLDVPADTAIAEAGCGQFEINLRHTDDILKAADDAQYLKYIVKHYAKRHEMGATFMAKPFGQDAGNGFHVHMSLVNKSGQNVFDNGGPEGTDLLRHAVGGMLETMADCTLVFAPFYNSYRRLRKEMHAPVHIGWGYENRTTAIRIPNGDGKDRRIEHRVAGADANPYLLLAAILAGALGGIERKAEAPEPIHGNRYPSDIEYLPANWRDAIDRFEKSDAIRSLFSPLLQRMHGAVKNQEAEQIADTVSQVEYDLYLDRV